MRKLKESGSASTKSAFEHDPSISLTNSDKKQKRYTWHWKGRKCVSADEIY
jgi:hypothetical protein